MSAQIISFNCILKNRAGSLISSTFNRDILNTSFGGESMLEGLAKGLQNLKNGERRTIFLKAEEAYGLYDPKKIILYPRKKILDEVREGSIVVIRGKSGTTRVYKVFEVLSNFVRLDGNHPLAGQDLIFEIEALSVRQATPDELDESVNGLENQVLH